MRGGTVCPPVKQRQLQGLSPHARGNQLAQAFLSKKVGPIPACAGEPRSHNDVSKRARAYPRMRGGTLGTLKVSNAFRGLSPHARGNLDAIAHDAVLLGPIPACAGEPVNIVSTYYLRGAYPRMRGGTSIPFSLPYPSKGLSPHARGNLLVLFIRLRLLGPIPACAGEPQSSDTDELCSGAYPRMRGGTAPIVGKKDGMEGLSPHARGNPIETGISRTSIGPIPACAGEPLG